MAMLPWSQSPQRKWKCGKTSKSLDTNRSTLALRRSSASTARSPCLRGPFGGTRSTASSRNFGRVASLKSWSVNTFTQGFSKLKRLRVPVQYHSNSLICWVVSLFWALGLVWQLLYSLLKFVAEKHQEELKNKAKKNQWFFPPEANLPKSDDMITTWHVTTQRFFAKKKLSSKHFLPAP